MSRGQLAPVLLLVALLTWPVASVLAAGDAARGAQLHASCLGCHGAELYAPGRARIKSLPALKREVERWNDRYNPKFSKQELADLVEYLNRNFYQFP